MSYADYPQTLQNIEHFEDKIQYTDSNNIEGEVFKDPNDLRYIYVYIKNKNNNQDNIGYFTIEHIEKTYIIRNTNNRTCFNSSIDLYTEARLYGISKSNATNPINKNIEDGYSLLWFNLSLNPKYIFDTSNIPDNNIITITGPLSDDMRDRQVHVFSSYRKNPCEQDEQESNILNKYKWKILIIAWVFIVLISSMLIMNMDMNGGEIPYWFIINFFVSPICLILLFNIITGDLTSLIITIIIILLYLVGKWWDKVDKKPLGLYQMQTQTQDYESNNNDDNYHTQLRAKTTIDFD